MGSQGEELVTGDILSFASEMKKLVNCKEMSDIKFLIGPNRKAVYGHRCILSARCQVFRAMFSEQSHKHNDKEVPLVLTDVTTDVFLPLLEYLYTNTVTLTPKIAVDVLGSAIEYGLDGLKELCIQYLTNSITVSSAADAMQAAVTYGQDQLRNIALSYIEQNTQAVFKTKSFHELAPGALCVILQSDELNLDEWFIIEAVREWATVNSVVLEKKIPVIASQVVHHLRLPLLSPDELKELEVLNAKDQMIPVNLFSNAWRVHALRKQDEENALTTPRTGTKQRNCHRDICKAN